MVVVVVVVDDVSVFVGTLSDPMLDTVRSTLCIPL